jgi:hypothetical protein
VETLCAARSSKRVCTCFRSLATCAHGGAGRVRVKILFAKQTRTSIIKKMVFPTTHLCVLDVVFLCAIYGLHLTVPGNK